MTVEGFRITNHGKLDFFIETSYHELIDFRVLIGEHDQES
jgi:hypothetical protein